jgi:hypothetical protein
VRVKVPFGEWSHEVTTASGAAATVTGELRLGGDEAVVLRPAPSR